MCLFLTGQVDTRMVACWALLTAAPVTQVSVKYMELTGQFREGREQSKELRWQLGVHEG